MISIFNTPILSLCNDLVAKRIIEKSRDFVWRSVTLQKINKFCADIEMMYADNGIYKKFVNADKATQTDICKQVYIIAFRLLEYTEPLSRKVKYMPEKRYRLGAFRN